MTLEIGQSMAHGGGEGAFLFVLFGRFLKVGVRKRRVGSSGKNVGGIYNMDGDRMVPFALPEDELSLVEFSWLSYAMPVS